jgi:hypothetical protein
MVEGVVGEGNMEFPHMVESMDWSHMWVPSCVCG